MIKLLPSARNMLLRRSNNGWWDGRVVWHARVSMSKP